jgi:aspartyl/asparaginyl-tRNA synthetase
MWLIDWDALTKTTWDTKKNKEYGKNMVPSFFYCDFPIKTSPFWNMKIDERDKNIAKKVDVVLYGMETIGSAERSCDPDEMLRLFHTISGGKYSERLYSEFSKERVDKELEEYLSYKF